MKNEALKYLSNIIMIRFNKGYSLLDYQIAEICTLINAILLDIIDPELVYEMRLMRLI
jgi:hypothetical protein